jgi:DNA-binding GntR family transcriptional regulator
VTDDRRKRETRTTPKYRRIADDLRGRIQAGEFGTGDYLPTKEQLMAHYEVALTTLSQAIKVLADEGWVESQQGVGTQVLDPPEPVPAPDFAALLKAFGELTGKVEDVSARLTVLEEASGASSS